ncbi:16S rRNA (uracil(1498)-N(3))-methyltransferase [Nitrosophilus kaiyonis]|uniref:16S rRNA (uracil(1498)-N(3))-methyltransferase n=1 Tax=Nitrosophilus kaiyonis TaxID=2930200 RepID=UPI002490F906|nr:16S rRNA (uracil(1498)-N(3))-methyltransferase [Nitrosophilus kaiyonis]
MQFVYHSQSGIDILKIEKDIYNYLFKVRREKVGETIPFRNLKDSYIYYYRIDDVSKRYAILSLREKIKKEVLPKRYLHIGWCVIEPKTIEKSIHFLNEIGVSKISFIYCDRSQKNFKINLDKLHKINISSSQQCGRSSLIEFEILKNIEEFIAKYKDFVLINFSQKKLENKKPQRVLIGCEGGFSDKELEILKNFETLGFDTQMVLKSETAAIAMSSKILI